MATRGFTEIQNDFGFTPQQAAQEKALLYKDVDQTKYEKCLKTAKFLETFEAFITEQAWNDHFDTKLETYLDSVASANMRLFMGMPKDTDLQVKPNKLQNKSHVMPDDQA